MPSTPSVFVVNTPSIQNLTATVHWASKLPMSMMLSVRLLSALSETAERASIAYQMRHSMHANAPFANVNAASKTRGDLGA